MADHKKLIRAPSIRPILLQRLPQLRLGENAFTERQSPARGWIGDNRTELEDPRLRLMRPISFEEYTLVVNQYSRRTLGDKGDILKAFAGLSKIFESCWQCNLTWGVPEALWDMSLLWQPGKGPSRRLDGSYSSLLS